MIIKQLKYNITPSENRVIEYIVIHDTGNKKSGADAYANFEYFNGGDRQASADYFVDSKGIWKVNDPKMYYTWHVGDGHGKNGIWNKNSIGIEMCVNTDGDFARTLANTVLLVRQLQAQYPAAKVVRHYDASGKNCPASLSGNNWDGWKGFLNMLKAPAPITPPPTPSVNEHWAEPYFKRLTETYGIKISERRFDDPVTRAELIVLLCRLMDANKK